nr:MAG TPA: heat shock protein 90 [Caudoviricetes sp.]
MDKEEYVPAQKEGEQGHGEVKNVQINRASALWQLPKSSLKPGDYNEFYKQISHDSGDPLFYIHTKAEGTQEYTTLFYVPSSEPFDLYRVDYQSGVKLYVKRVFITDDAKELLPSYLRFVRGIMDVEDLPLNVSREILQENRILTYVREQSVKKILSELEKLLQSDREKYIKFYELFGKVLKEGLYGFGANKEEILKLCLFKSNLRDGLITLSEYKEKMGAEQKEIYYIAGNSAAMLKSSPLIEKFNAEGTEVLLCDDEIDTIVMPGVFEFDKTPVKNATSIKQEAASDDAATPQAKEIAAKIKEILGERVKDVKISSRLSGSLSCLVFDENDPDFATQQLLKQMGNRNLPPIKPILEINADHEIVKKLQADKLMLPQVAEIIYDLARLSEGQELENPSEFIKNVNELIAKAL